MGRPPASRAALFAAAMALLIVVSVALVLFTGVLFLGLLIPLLPAWVALRQGSGWAYATAGVAFVLSLLLPGGAIVALPCLIGGVALGSALEQRSQPLLTGVMVTVALLSGMLLLLAGYRLLAGTNFISLFRQQLEESAKLWPPGLISPDVIKSVADQFASYFPAYLVLVSAVWSLITYVLARWTLGRSYDVPPTAPFDTWRLPRWLGLLLIPFLLMSFAAVRGAMVGRVGTNSLFLLTTLYGVQGMACIYFWLKRRMGRIGGGVVATILVLIPVVNMLPTFLGLWDSLFDFRKLGHRPGQ